MENIVLHMCKFCDTLYKIKYDDSEVSPYATICPKCSNIDYVYFKEENKY